MAAGFGIFALASWLLSGIASDWGFWQLLLPQGLRGFSMLLCIVPAVGLALNGFAPQELRYASGLFNLMRNLGGAIGIAAVTTWLQDFGRLHSERFGEALAHANSSALAGLSAHLSAGTSDPAHARQLLEAEIARAVTQQALTQAFQDVFYLIAAMFVLALAIIPLTRPALFKDDALAKAH
jgi:DHA2 family multidrug resistance protein